MDTSKSSSRQLCLYVKDNKKIVIDEYDLIVKSSPLLQREFASGMSRNAPSRHCLAVFSCITFTTYINFCFINQYRPAYRCRKPFDIVQILFFMDSIKFSKERVNQILGPRFEHPHWPGWNTLNYVTKLIFFLNQTRYNDLAKEYTNYYLLPTFLLGIKTYKKIKRAIRNYYRRHFNTLNRFAVYCKCRLCNLVRHERLVYAMCPSDMTPTLPFDVEKRFGRIGLKSYKFGYKK